MYITRINGFHILPILKSLFLLFIIHLHLYKFIMTNLIPIKQNQMIMKLFSD